MRYKEILILIFLSFSLEKIYSSEVIGYIKALEQVPHTQISSQTTKKLLSRIDQYIDKNKTNFQVLQKDQKKLLNMREKFINLIKIRETFDQCSIDQEMETIYKQTFKQGYESAICPNIQDYSKIEAINLYENISPILYPRLKDALIDELMANSMKELIDRLNYLNWRYKAKVLTEKDIEKLCQFHISTNCTQEIIDKIKPYLKSSIRKINSSGVLPIKEKKLLEKLKKGVNHIKRNSLDVKFTFKSGISCFGDDVMADGDSYNNYIDAYTRELSNQDGLLLFSPHIRTNIVSLKDPKKDYERNHCTGKNRKYSFTKDNEDLKNEDVKVAINETLEKSEELAKDILANYNRIYKAKKRIKRYKGLTTKTQRQNKKNLRNTQSAFIKNQLRYHPKSFSKVLIKRPEYAFLACNYLNKIQQKNKRNEEGLELLSWGSLVLGGGVGGLGIRSIILGFTGKKAASAAGGRLAGNLGIGVSGLSATTSSFSAYQNSILIKRFEESILLDSGDLKSSLIQRQNTLRKFYDEIYDGSIAIGLGVLNFSALRYFSGGAKEVKAMTQNLKMIKKRLINNPKALKKLKASKKYLSEKDISHFLTSLSQMPKKTIKFVMSKMPGISSVRLAKIIKGIKKKITKGCSK